MQKNKEIAKSMILSYLGSKLSLETVAVSYEISKGNDELLLEHVKALKNIFEKAIEEIENDKGTH